jgi:hypothetical protein
MAGNKDLTIAPVLQAVQMIFGFNLDYGSHWQIVQMYTAL